MNSKDIQLNRKRKNFESNDRNDKKSRLDERNGTNGESSGVESNLWVDKHRPLSTRAVIGQQGDKSCVNKLMKWLNDWFNNLDKKPTIGKFGCDDGQGFRAALLSGPPGVGKTTSAQLVCKELGFDFIELNASDVRSKKSLDSVVKELRGNTSLFDYFNDKSGKTGVTARHVLIMDEVDGMAGTEDRGGIAELIQFIKTTKVPIICICNDRSHIKIRSLVNYCFDLRFYKPRVEQIKGAMMSIAYKEGIKITPNVLHELIVSSNQDIRQVLHNLSLLSTGTKQIDNLLSDQSIKDIRLGPFEAVKKVFSSGEEYARMSFQDKADLFFCDYSIMPLFNFENYPHVNPSNAKTEVQKLKQASKAIEAMAFGDIIEKQIRTTNNWSLLPLEAAFASVMPGAYMNGRIGQQINFPSFMGKLSTTNKRNRLLQELKMHMNLKVSGSKTALNLDYLEPLRDAIIEPLVLNGTGGVPAVIEKLENYCLRREDIESIIELTLWSNQKDPMTRVDSKTKSALTRAYNKEGFCLPYSYGTATKGKKSKIALDLDELGEGLADEDSVVDEDEAEEEDIKADAMIKTKKKTVKNVTEKEPKSKAKTNKSKKSETKTEEIKKSKKEQKSEPKSEPKTSPKKDSLSESTNERKNRLRTRPGPKESPIKSPEKELKVEPKKSPKKELKVEPKTTPKSQPKKEVKSPAKRGTKTENKSKTKTESKSEPKSESKSKKSQEISKTNTSSKGRQLTLNSFFTKK